MSHGTPTPLYRRICNRVLREVERGTLGCGARLPSSRQLARDLGVSRITVVTAYEALQADGVVQTRARSGTFVVPAQGSGVDAGVWAGSGIADCPWDGQLAPGPNPLRARMMEQVLQEVTSDRDIPFFWGAGDPRLFPAAELRRIVNRVLRRDGAAALGPERPEGYPGLCRALARYIRKLGITVADEELVVTNGSQQAINLVAEALLRPGDRVVVEAPTWPGALEAFEARGAELLGVPLDDEGLRADLLEPLLAREKPRLIYTVPTFHNPTGRVMSTARRRRIVALARRHGVLILEDDALREVRFGSALPPPLAALGGSGHVAYVGSFTKALLPAARIGYFVGPPKLREWVVARRRSTDLFSSSLMQRAVAAYLESGAAVRYWRRLRRVYEERHRAMLAALERHFPPGTRWRPVAGGPQMWVRVPDGVSVRALSAEAARAGVPFAPGEAFFPRPADQPYLRLNFAVLDPARIEHGVAVLGSMLAAKAAAPCGVRRARRSPNLQEEST